MGLEGKIFSHVFCLSYLISFLNYTVKNNILQSIFLSLFSILPVFTPTKHILNDIGESLITIATSLIIIANIILGIQQKMREFRMVQLCHVKR